MTEREAAGLVIDKVLGMSKSPRRIAVFVGKNKNTIQMTRPDTEVFAKAIALRLHDFCAVYDDFATEQMIIDDLRYAGFQA